MNPEQIAETSKLKTSYVGSVALQFERWYDFNSLQSRTLEDAMKTQYTVALSMLFGFGLGVIAIQGLHAQAKPPVYTVTEANVTNVDAYMKEFVPVVQPLVKKSGGKIIASSLKPTAISGTPPNRVTINVWDSLAAAQAFYGSAEFKAAEAIGSKYATFTRFVVDGVPQ